MKAYQAYSNGRTVTAATPKGAALAFFERFPTARKCDVTEGQQDGHFFTVTYGRASNGEWSQRWKDVTKKQIDQLPG